MKTLTPTYSTSLFIALAMALAVLGINPPVAQSAERSVTEILIVVGPSNHPPGTHEVAAGGRLLEHCLNQAENLNGIRARVVYEWPADSEVLHRAATVVFLGDQFPGERMKQSDETMTQLEQMMDRGCGMVCIHYATGLGREDVASDGEHPLLRWTGGYFATQCDHHQSIARVFDATIDPAENEHPVLRGWKSFSLRDEPYYNNYFGPRGLAPHATALATSMLPPEKPNRETVAWAIERPDGGRGMGIVMPHFYQSWRKADLRKFILNGIVWTAKREVPEEGVNSTLPDLATFEPASVDPK